MNKQRIIIESIIALAAVAVIIGAMFFYSDIWQGLQI